MALPERRPGVESLEQLIVGSIQTGTVSDSLLVLSPTFRNPRSSLAWEAFYQGSTSRQLGIIFNSYPPQLQEEFRDAVVSAVSNWTLEKQGPRVLKDLSWLVADTLALKAIEPLCGFVETDLIVNGEHEEFQNSVEAAIGVIGGFAEFDKTRGTVREVFERWFGDPAYERYSAMLLNGLCQCSPENFPQYFPRFLEVARMHPDYFDLDFVVAVMTGIVSPQIISECLNALPPETRELLITSLPTSSGSQ